MLWLCQYNLFGQDFPELSFRNLTKKDGLSSNSISTIFQSKDGQMWIATDLGLNKYDGTRFETIYKGNKYYNTYGNNIKALRIDNKDNLWVSDFERVFSLNLKNGKSVMNNVHKEASIFSLDNKGNFYYAHSKGIICIDHNYVQKSIFLTPNNEINNEIIKDIYIDNEGCYIAVTAHQVAYFDTNNKIKKIYPISAISLFIDHNNDCWINTWGEGLFKIEQDGSLKKKFDIAGNTACLLKEWTYMGETYLIIPTIGYGIYLYHYSTNSIRQYPIEFYINSINVDSDNNLWLGTNKGILIYSQFSESLKAIPIIDKIKNKNNSEIYNIYESNEYYWVAKRYYQGFYQYNKYWQLIKHYAIPLDNPNENFISDGYDFIEHNGFVYVSYDYGFYKINLKDRKVKKIIYPNKQEIKLRNIVKISEEEWLVRSFNSGVVKFNPNKELFELCKPFTSIINQNVFTYLFETSNHDILLSTNFGIHKYNRLKQQFEIYQKEILGNISSYGIAEDQNNNLWIGTVDGMMGFSPKSNKIIEDFKDYQDAGETFRVNVDGNNNVWFANVNGYWCWHQEAKKMSKINFDAGQITQNDQPNIFKNSKNEIFLAGTKYLYQVTLDSIGHSVKDRSGIFTVHTDKEHLPYYQFNSPSKSVSLKAGSSFAKINISIPDYSSEKPYEYYYKVKDDWVNIDNGEVTTSNLNSGKNTFEFKAINSQNLNEIPLGEMILNITPFWYETILFKLFIVTILSLLAFGLIRWVTKTQYEKKRLQSDFQHKVLQLEIQNLRSQMNPHFIFNCINSIDAFIQSQDKYNASIYLNKFAKLIRNILESSKQNLVSFEKDIETMKIYTELEEMRSDHKFKTIFTIDPIIYESDIKVPPLIIQPYVENAIIHGVRNKKEKGGLIEICATLSAEQIIYTIKDNGIGRAAASKISKTKDLSYGMQLSEDRVKLFNEENSTNNIKIVDLNVNGEDTGTIIEVKLKIN